MSLTEPDVKKIRLIVREEVESIISTRVEPRFDNVEGKLETLENDIKDIYEMIADLQKLTRQVAHFEKYDLEQKVVTAYKGIVAIAQQEGIKLPRQ